MRALRTRLFVWPLEDRVTPAVFTVTTAADTGAGSLRDAITQSNGSTGSLPNVINFDATFFSTPRSITLGSVLPTFTQPVTLNGTTARNVVISGNNAVQIMRTGTAAGVTLNDVTLANGRGSPGGAVYVASGNALTLNRSTVTGNVSSGSGGAVYFFSGGTFNATGCTFSNNQGGGSGGGAVYFWAAVTSTIADCTFTGNTTTSSGGGGAIRLNSFSGTLNVRNSTLTGNTATVGTGGAIGGTGGTVNVFSSIVAGNTGGASPNIAAGTVSVNFSAIDNTAGFTLSGTSGNNLTAAQSTVANLALGALANNGGPTDTMMPGAASTALDAGSNSFGLVTDQRGFGFYRTYSAAGVQKADIGAAERQPAGLPFAQATAANVTVPGPSPNTFTVTYTAAGGALINVGSLGTGDVNLTGPGGYNVTPTFVSAFPNVSSPAVTATYSFVPPGGAWDAADNGTYTVAMNANQVFDTAATPLAVPAVTVGTFTAVLPVTFVVTTLSDTGAGSLRNAITQANADTTTADFIAFQPGLTGTITLASTLPTITGPVTINGPGAGVVTVSGNNAVRPFAVNGTGVFNVGLNGLTISGGNAASGFGGGVYVTDENLSMDGVVISGNTIAGQGGGIGFSGAGTLMLTNSTVSGNTATGGDGGGIYFFSGGSFVIRNCTISGNTAGAATGGGGVYFWGAANTAGLPAGFTSGTLVLQNSTVAANTTGALGGGIFLNNFGTSTMLVQNSTIVGNTSTATTTGGGGIRVNSGTLTLQNTVVSGNTNTTSPDISNAGGGTVNANFSAIGSATGLTLSGTSGNNLAYGANLQLGTLGSNGGPTQTFVPASTSPLLDAGSNALIPPVLTTDQRGLPLNRVYNAVVDIGAVERQPFPPLVTVASTPLTYTENGPAVVLDPALTVVDFDSTNLTSVVVTVSNYVAGEDVLGFNVAALPTGVTANTGVPGQITFAGLATPAMYQALLQTVTYANASDNPTTTPRGITFTAFDDSSPVPLAGPTVTRTVSIAAVNDAPVNAVPGTMPVVIASTTGPIPGVSVTDVDVGTGTLTVTVSVPAASGGTFGGTGFTAGTGTNSITVTGTSAAVAAALGSLTFTAPATPQFITATVATSDNGNSGTGGTLTDTDTFTIFAADPLPVVVTTGGATTYTENAPPVVIDAGVTVADNGAQLSGGTVQVTGGYTFGVDVLSFTPGGGVTGSFDAATGTLTLTGVAPLATYQAALRSVRFEAQGDNPPGGTRTVTFVVSDSPALGPPGPSVPVAKTVTVVPVNDPPVNAVPAGPVPTAEDTPLVLPVLLVTDPDNATTTVTLSVANGTLDLTAAGGATVGGSGSGTVTVSGTFPQVNATLAGTLTYTPAADYFGPDALTVASSDGLLTDTDMLAIDVTPVNDPPVIGSLGGPATYQLGHPATPIATTATVVDVDSPDLAGGRLTVLIATGGQAADVLGVADQGTGPGQVGVSGTTVTYGGTPIGTLSGGTTGTPLVLLLNASATPAAVQAVARAVTFQTQTAGVILGARNLSFTLTDGDGGTSAAATLAVQVAPSTAPVLTLGGTGIAYTENDLATAIDAGAAVADADSATFANGNLRVDFAGGATTSDRLVILDGGIAPGQIGVSAPRVTYGGTLIGTFTGGTGPGSPLVVTLNANATPAAVQQLVRSVAYANAGDDPGPATRTVRFTLNDGNLGVSTAVTAAVAVTPVNDAPVNTLPAGATDEDTNLAVTGVSVADPDTQGNAIRVTLTAANGTVQLPAVPGLTVTGSGTANVVLDGPLVNVNAALAGLTFRPTADYFGPASVQFVTTDRGFTPGPVQTTTDTLAITVNPVNDAPVLGAVGGTTVYQLGHPAAAVVPAATAVDIDSPDLGGGTLTVALTAGGTAADVLAVQNQGAGAGQIG
ncbi:MAG: right-handed parallel beta-helix repeat-containing protein, partial [Gemmataceae bacterium]|nr:right-handed parallel beta-helix repeat-containing protein [Gemmataceae bacterium]